MSLWLNPSVSVTSSSDKVSSWVDPVSGITLSQADSNLQPTLVADSISFDGIDDHIDSSDSVDVKNVFIVFKVDSTAQESNQLAGVFGNYGEGTHVGVDPRSHNLHGYSFDGGSNTTASYSQDLSNYEASAEDSNAQNGLMILCRPCTSTTIVCTPYRALVW